MIGRPIEAGRKALDQFVEHIGQPKPERRTGSKKVGGINAHNAGLKQSQSFFANSNQVRLFAEASSQSDPLTPQTGADMTINIIHNGTAVKMSTNDAASYHTSAGTDHKAATLEYIIEMLGQLSLLALGIGEVRIAEDLRGTANAYGASSDSREKAQAAN